MIKADLVNTATLLKTIRYDTNTALWMQYVCLSKRMRQELQLVSAKAHILYRQHDTYATLSWLTFMLSLLTCITAVLYTNTIILAATAILFAIFYILEFKKRDIILSLAPEIIDQLFTTQPPSGTLFQFGEELARRYNITSFVIFMDRLESLLKQTFMILYVSAGFIYLSTDWKTWVYIIMLLIAWPFFLRPIKILRFALRLS